MKNLRRILLLVITLLGTEYLTGQEPGWSVNPDDYKYSCYIISEVYLGNEFVKAGTLGAFVGTECRGVAEATIISERAVFFLTCYSDLVIGETLQFRYYDPVGDDEYEVNETIPFESERTYGSSEIPYQFHIKVNTAPVVENIPDQTVPEGETFTTIALDDFVVDAESPDADITWSYSGNSALIVSVVNRIATIDIPDADWNGSETIIFTATDPEGLSGSDTATFTVTPVNDAPVVGDIPDQTIAEGEIFEPIVLDDYVTDVDNTNAEISWSYSGNVALAVSIVSGIATITPLDINWNGTETITFIATDPGLLFDSDSAVFTVTAVNDPPVLADIETTPLDYTENATATIITNTITVTDVDDTNLESAVISISDNYQSEQDILSFTDANGIFGTWVEATGILTLNGSASLADYQMALRSIRYFNNSDNPSTLTRTISFTVHDGTDAGLPITRQISVTAVNDVPVADSVAFEGTMISDSTLTGSYIYSDAEGDPEGTSVFAWYRADNASGLNEIAIPDAIARTYTLTTADAGKYISFQVTPVAASGNSPGIAVRSDAQLVIKLPDGWEIDPQNYDYDGIVTASVSVDGTARISGILAGFAGEECRGITCAAWHSSTDSYVFRMTLYSDNQSGDIITFRYFDPLSDEVYDMDRSVDFVPEMSIGTYESPFDMKNGTLLQQVHPSGWSWFSMNTVLDNMTLNFILSDVSDGDYIKSQIYSATYYEGYGWYGTLTSIDPSELYKIRLDNGCITEFTGRLVDADEVSIPVSSGWNWIGFLPQTSMSIDIALSSLSLANLDYIKSQKLSATYYSEYGWFGSLDSMSPSQGYMIRLTNSGSLKYNDSGKKSGQISAETNNSQFDFRQYENNGEIAAVIIQDGMLKGSVNDSLIAYVNNEIRGVTTAQYFEITKKWMFSLMIYSNVTMGETVSFKYYDSANRKYYTCNETIPFVQNSEPDRINPYELHTSIFSSVEEQNINKDLNIRVYPNPFEYNLNLDYSIPEIGRVKITVFDTFGRPVRILTDEVQEPGDYQIRWDTDLPSAGVYFIRVEAGRRQKILKSILMRSY